MHPRARARAVPRASSTFRRAAGARRRRRPRLVLPRRRRLRAAAPHPLPPAYATPAFLISATLTCREDSEQGTPDGYRSGWLVRRRAAHRRYALDADAGDVHTLGLCFRLHDEHDQGSFLLLVGDAKFDVDATQRARVRSRPARSSAGAVCPRAPSPLPATAPATRCSRTRSVART
jgi:hypothetical protein